jgi:hypothetical protein
MRQRIAGKRCEFVKLTSAFVLPTLPTISCRFRLRPGIFSCAGPNTGTLYFDPER